MALVAVVPQEVVVLLAVVGLRIQQLELQPDLNSSSLPDWEDQSLSAMTTMIVNLGQSPIALPTLSSVTSKTCFKNFSNFSSSNLKTVISDTLSAILKERKKNTSVMTA